MKTSEYLNKNYDIYVPDGFEIINEYYITNESDLRNKIIYVRNLEEYTIQIYISIDSLLKRSITFDESFYYNIWIGDSFYKRGATSDYQDVMRVFDEFYTEFINMLFHDIGIIK